MMLFNNWLPKDNRDQTLHGLAGFGISLIPVLILKYLVGVDMTIVLFLLLGISYIVSVMAGLLREYYQHKRFVFNLDMFFWLIGATMGNFAAWIVLLFF